MITGGLFITKHSGTKDIMTFPTIWQAEYYLHLIPMMQVDGNEEALEIHRAKLGAMKWNEIK